MIVKFINIPNNKIGVVFAQEVEEFGPEKMVTRFSIQKQNVPDASIRCHDLTKYKVACLRNNLNIIGDPNKKQPNPHSDSGH